MYNKVVFAGKPTVIPACQANPILKAAVFCEKVLSPDFLCSEENFGFNTLWQYTGIWTKIICDVLSNPF
jgi:hypothetical protein